MSAQRAGARRVEGRASARALDKRHAIDGSLAGNCSCSFAPCGHDRVGDTRAAANRRSLSNLTTIVAFSALLRARVPDFKAGTAKGSIAASAAALRLEQLGAAPPGGLARAVAAAEDRARRGAR